MTREEMKSVKAGDLLTTKYGSIILVERVEFGENAVCVYDYFDYDKEMGIQMNEWLDRFYGPKFDEDFYRHSTDEEKEFFFSELEKYGYIMTERYGKAVPTQTPKEYHRHHCKQQLQGLDEAAEEYAINHYTNSFDQRICIKEFKAGAEYQYQIDRGEFAKLKTKEWSDGYKEGHEAGAEWMAGQDKEKIEQAFFSGYNECEDRMKKEFEKRAMAGEVNNTGYPTTIQLHTFDSSLKNDDKVNIIIMKQEQK